MTVKEEELEQVFEKLPKHKQKKRGEMSILRNGSMISARELKRKKL
jgi:hypothetical protein